MEQKFTEKQEKFLDALFSPECKGHTGKAFDAAGYERDKRARSRTLHQLSDEIIARAKIYLAATTAKAAISLDGVLDTPESMGNRSTLAAAREILDRVGIIKKEQIEHSGNVGGLFILPPKEEIVDAELEASEEVK